MMMKVRLVCAAFAVASSVLLAAEPAEQRKPIKDMTPAERQQLKVKMLAKIGGGRLARPGSQKGEIVIVNAQKRADAKWLAEVAAYLNKDTHFSVRVADGAFNAAKPGLVGTMTLYVIDDGSQPRSLIAPDDRWAMCNVSQLYTDKTPFFTARVKKQVSRTFGQLCGGMASNFEKNLVSAMPKPEDLDDVTDFKLPVDVTARMKGYLAPFGMTPATIRTYKIACQEGWAPNPTNDVQKYIWDEVHQLPTNPLPLVKPTK